MTLTCPSQPELLLFALADASAAADPIARHVAECASCQVRVAEFRRLASGIRASASGEVGGDGECLDEVALAEFVEGIADVGRRERSILHLAACGHCRRQLASLVDLLADHSIAGEVRQVERLRDRPAPRRRFLAGAGLIAAAAAAVLIVWTGIMSLHPSGPETRDSETSPIVSLVPRPLAPLGDVSRPDGLLWSAVPDVARYRVTLFTNDGQAAWQTTTTDTFVTLPDTLRLATATPHYWQVKAETGFGRWVESELVAFTIRRGDAPR